LQRCPYIGSLATWQDISDRPSPSRMRKNE
jgi:hypothetical protein